MQNLKVDLWMYPENTDPTTIGSVSKFLLLSHVVRNPILVDKNASLNGDLLSSWNVSADQKTFTLTFREDQKFNNGEVILAKHFVETIKFRQAHGPQVHFNFNEITAITQKGPVVILKTRRSSPLLITQLALPEFGVLHPSTMAAPKNGPKICSGYYCLKSYSPSQLILTKNTYAKSQGPDSIEINSHHSNRALEIENGNLDFALTFDEPPTPSASSPWEVVAPHIGFTHWLTLNPNSANIGDDETRKLLQKRIHFLFSKTSIEQKSFTIAKQLFLPGGPGRLPTAVTDKFWSSGSGDRPITIEKLSRRTLTVLLSNNFTLLNQLKSVLDQLQKELGCKIDISTYTNQDEFAKMIAAKSYDLYLINNDFSGFDLTLGMVVTFNKDKPLIVLPTKDAKISSKLADLFAEPLIDKRSQIMAQISNDLLEDGLVVPLVYRSAFFIKRKNLNIEEWSMLFPEISFWKSRLE